MTGGDCPKCAELRERALVLQQVDFWQYQEAWTAYLLHKTRDHCLHVATAEVKR